MPHFERIVIASHVAGRDPALEKVAQQVRARDADSPMQNVYVVSSKQSRRETLDTILSAASVYEADLLVLGARSHLLASRAAMLAPCSVLMVPDDMEFRLRRVLIPVDFSSHSQDALRIGYDLASRATEDGEAICLFVESEDAPWHSHRDEQVEHEIKLRELQSFARSTLGAHPAPRCLAEALERSGALLEQGSLSLPHAIEGADIASTIEAVAKREDADLIVIATRGRSRSAAVLLGSVTEKVMQFARRPVLAVKPWGTNLGLLDLLSNAKS
jgi:SulP family sulfate permease